MYECQWSAVPLCRNTHTGSVQPRAASMWYSVETNTHHPHPTPHWIHRQLYLQGELCEPLLEM